MWVVCQVDDPFVCFGAKPNKGMSSRSSTRPEVGKGTPEKAVGKGTPEMTAGKRNPEKANCLLRVPFSSEGWRRGAVDNGQQKRPVGVR